MASDPTELSLPSRRVSATLSPMLALVCMLLTPDPQWVLVSSLFNEEETEAERHCLAGLRLHSEAAELGFKPRACLLAFLLNVYLLF